VTRVAKIPNSLSPYQRHVKRWSKCCKCSLHKQRRKVVIARGSVPTDILFVGEAPGASEDVIGRPFVGPAGKLLDRIINQAIDGQFDYCLTNLVCCIPKDEAVKGKLGAPPTECVIACAPRLYEFIQLCKPRLIVAVGQLSAKHIPQKDLSCPVIEIIHPAAILRMDISQQSLAYQRCVVALEDAIEDL
jgi:DNA polymerase